MNLPDLFNQVPPHNADAERALLGALLLSPSATPEAMETLNSQDFFDKSNGEIFAAIVASFQRYGLKYDVLAIRDELQGVDGREEMPRYLIELAQASPGPTGVPVWVKMIRAHAIARRIIAGASQAIYDAYHSRDIDDVQEVATVAVDQISRAVQHLESGRGQTVGAAAYELLAEIDAGKRQLLETGMEWFDTLAGGLPESGVVTLIGNPSHGKTTFGLTLVAHLAERYGGGGVIHSVEQGPRRVAGTLLSVYSGCPVHEWMNVGYRPDDMERMNTLGAAKRLEDMGVRVEPDSIDAGEIFRRAIHGATKGVRRVMVDYIQDLKPVPGFRNDAEGMSESMRLLARIATELNMLVIVVSQMDKESRKQNRAPLLNDGRGAAAIGDRTDMGISVWRPHFNDRPEDHLDHMGFLERRAKTEFVISKNKYGSLGQTTVRFDGKTMRFNQ